MTDVGQDTSDETRRRLLKGALAASTVVTLGYGGAAAAASLGCIEKLGSVDLPDSRFVRGAAPPAGSIWVWRHVDVWSYKVADDQPFEGFVVNDKVYRASDPYDLVLDAVLEDPQPVGYPKDGWVLAYFDSNGDEVGSYPEALESDGVPVTGSCLASINPGLLPTAFSG